MFGDVVPETSIWHVLNLGEFGFKVDLLSFCIALAVFSTPTGRRQRRLCRRFSLWGGLFAVFDWSWKWTVDSKPKWETKPWNQTPQDESHLKAKKLFYPWSTKPCFEDGLCEPPPHSRVTKNFRVLRISESFVTDHPRANEWLRHRVSCGDRPLSELHAKEAGSMDPTQYPSRPQFQHPDVT